MRPILLLLLLPTLAAAQVPLRPMTIQEMLAFVREQRSSRWSMTEETQVETRLLLLGMSDDARQVARYVPSKSDVPLLLKWMKDRTLDVPARLCMARFLLPLGHLGARKFIDTQLASKDKRTVHEAAGAVHHHVREDARETRVWGTDRLIALLKERKLEDFVQHSNVFSHVIYNLGHLKVQRAVPVLAEMLRREPYDQSVPAALAMIGDKDGDTTVVRVLMDTLIDAEKKHMRRAQIHALGRLRHKPAAPILCRWLLRGSWASPILVALSRIRDPASAPTLKAFIKRGGRAAEILEAPLALAVLERDPVPTLLALLAKEKDRHGQVQLIWALKTYRDDRVTKRFLTLARTSKLGVVRAHSIFGLGAVATPKAVEGLVALLDVTFPPLWYAKRNDPKEYHRYVGRALRDATGLNYGTDRAGWKRYLDNR